jgi:hypothetical protein
MVKIITVNDVELLVNSNGNVTIVEAGKKLKFNKRKKYKTKNGGYESSVVNGRTVYLHRLLALAFIKNVRHKPCINHIDGDGSNNSVSNLEWVTYSENIQHAYDLGLRTTEKKIIVTHVRTGNKYYFKSLSLALKYTNQNKTTAHRFLNGTYKNPKTYNYQYQ